MQSALSSLTAGLAEFQRNPELAAVAYQLNYLQGQSARIPHPAAGAMDRPWAPGSDLRALAASYASAQQQLVLQLQQAALQQQIVELAAKAGLGPARPASTLPAPLPLEVSQGGAGRGAGGRAGDGPRAASPTCSLSSCESADAAAPLFSPPSAASSPPSLCSSPPQSSPIAAAAGAALPPSPGAHDPRAGRTHLYKTELCKNFEEKGACRYGSKCQFAHGLAEMRPLPRHPKYKSSPCIQFWTYGTCAYGTRCRFSHGAVTSAERGRNSPGAVGAAAAAAAEAASRAGPAPGPAEAAAPAEARPQGPTRRPRRGGPAAADLPGSLRRGPHDALFAAPPPPSDPPIPPLPPPPPPPLPPRPSAPCAPLFFDRDGCFFFSCEPLV
eukprot:tig00000507_g1779.t1